MGVARFVEQRRAWGMGDVPRVKQHLIPTDTSVEVPLMRPHTAPGSGMVIFRRDDSDGLVRVIGEVDLANVDYFASVLRTEARRTSSLTLDVSRLSFLGLDGCQVIRRVARDLHGRGGRLRLVDPKPLIKRMFLLVGSDGNQGLELVDSRPGRFRAQASSARRPRASTRGDRDAATLTATPHTRA